MGYVLCLVAQSCPTLCNPMTIAHQALLSMGILQARILEWVAMPFSRESSHPRKPPQAIEPGSLALQADSLPSESLTNSYTNNKEGLSWWLKW